MNPTAAALERPIVHRTKGKNVGSLVRLISPGELGEVLKPFVFLAIFSLGTDREKAESGMHPHSGITTVTFMIDGDIAYEDTTGAAGVLPAGGLELMYAGNGVWHDAVPTSSDSILGFQLWVALPASEENGPAKSVYLAPFQIPQVGPVRVLLGQYKNAHSIAEAPSGVNYLAVRLKDGESWRYTPPAGHTVAWLAVESGCISAGSLVTKGELAVFEESEQPIEIVAQGETAFVLGSAAKHPHDLVTGYYSVHTSKEAMAKSKTEIHRIAARLRQEGRLNQVVASPSPQRSD
ncbi:pirin family protein [Pseudomonas syringae group genomosp. 3]|uniref:pirin family protein n=1 Tax=Pseudomonas syringae group genomosp. 3 TaxID=251701 RepID=UPI000EFF640B|nr:pirin family protein [Pseudomonas syringae group genomosp. 3]